MGRSFWWLAELFLVGMFNGPSSVDGQLVSEVVRQKMQNDSVEYTNYADDTTASRKYRITPPPPIPTRDSSILQESDVDIHVDVFAAIEPNTFSVVIEGLVYWYVHPNITIYYKEFIFTMMSISDSPRCKEGFPKYQRLLNRVADQMKIPPVSGSESQSMLLHRCSYNIELILYPCGAKFKLPSCSKFQKKFTIGDCVGIFCECTRSRSPAPPTNVEAISQPLDNNKDTVSISWIYNATNNDSAQNSRFEISISEYSRTVPIEHYFGIVPYNATRTFYQIDVNLTANKKYEARVYAVDKFTCASEFVDKNVTEKKEIVAERKIQPKPSAMQKIVVICFATVCSITSIVAGSGFYAWRKRKKELRKAYVHAIQRSGILLKNANTNCVTQGAALNTDREDFNLLYVEQEIQEARDKGEVDAFEISYNRLTMGPEIGKGAFGRVCVASAECIAGIPGKIQVAVKHLRENANDMEIQDFLNEIKMLKSAGRHPNVVAMLGCCTLREPHCMVMEFIAKGDLLEYLRKLRSEYEKITGKMMAIVTGRVQANSALPSLTGAKCDVTRNNGSPIPVDRISVPGQISSGGTDPSNASDVTDETELITSGDTDANEAEHNGPPDGATGVASTEAINDRKPSSGLDPMELQAFALQIARGMEHLAGLGIVHRDLAARNVLINDKKVLKISDFGLSRTGTYVTHRGGRVPLRWLSIEAFTQQIYSTKSDVWSFGVVLWEICTLGGFPYQYITDQDIFTYLLKNNRLEQPVHCSEELYDVMRSCWMSEAADRPTFAALCITLEDLSRKLHTYVNFDVKFKNCDGQNSLPAAQELSS